jgi:hypothetical protein
VKQFGPGGRPGRVEASTDSALKLIGSHGRSLD